MVKLAFEGLWALKKSKPLKNTFTKSNIYLWGGGGGAQRFDKSKSCLSLSKKRFREIRLFGWCNKNVYMKHAMDNICLFGKALKHNFIGQRNLSKADRGGGYCAHICLTPFRLFFFYKLWGTKSRSKLLDVLKSPTAIGPNFNNGSFTNLKICVKKVGS